VTLQHYLSHRRRYELLISIAVVLLINATGATTEIMENLQIGGPSDWQAAWAKELTSGLAVLLLLPLLAVFLKRLNLSFANLRWRVLWHLPGYLVFFLLHIGLFSVLRMGLWSVAGESYEPGSLGWNLVYEMRKDLLVYGGIVTLLMGYEFILTRLQGEASFLAAGAGNDDGSMKPGRGQFLVKMLNREYLVRVEEIDWVESAGNYVLMHCGERSYPMRFTLVRLAAELDQRQFMRVHRTAIVNLSRVAAIREVDELRAELTSGALVPVSRTYLPELRKVLVAA